MKAVSKKLTLLCAVCLVAALATSAAPAGAAFPGKNGKIAFVRGMKIHTADSDGSHVKRIRKSSSSDPSFSSNGRRIVFAGEKGIYIARADSGKVDKIRHTGAGANSASLSPDGRTIAYIGKDRNLRTIRVDGTHKRKVTHRKGGIGLFGTSFSPDGRYVVTSLCNLYRITLNSGHVKKIYDPGAGEVCATDPDVSPNGKRVVFEYDYAPDHHVLTVGIDGKKVLSVIGSYKIRAEAPVYSPNGERILFEAQIPGRHRQELMTADSKNGKRRHGLGIGGYAPSWGVAQ